MSNQPETANIGDVGLRLILKDDGDTYSPIERSYKCIKGFGKRSKSITAGEPVTKPLLDDLSSRVIDFLKKRASEGRTVLITHLPLDVAKVSFDLSVKIENDILEYPLANFEYKNANIAQKKVVLHEASTFRLSDFFTSAQLRKAFTKAMRNIIRQKNVPKDIYQQYNSLMRLSKIKDRLFGSSGLLFILTSMLTLIEKLKPVLTSVFTSESGLYKLPFFPIALILGASTLISFISAIIIRRKAFISVEPDYDLLIRSKEYKKLINFNKSFLDELIITKTEKLWKDGCIHIVANALYTDLTCKIILDNVLHCAPPDGKFLIVFLDKGTKAFGEINCEKITTYSGDIGDGSDREYVAWFELVELDANSKQEYLTSSLARYDEKDRELVSFQRTTYTELLNHFGIDILYLSDVGLHRQLSEEEKAIIVTHFTDNNIEQCDINALKLISYAAEYYFVQSGYHHVIPSYWHSHSGISTIFTDIDKILVRNDTLNICSSMYHGKAARDKLFSTITSIPITDLNMTRAGENSGGLRVRLWDVGTDAADLLMIKMSAFIRYVCGAESINKQIADGRRDIVAPTRLFSTLELARLFIQFQSILFLCLSSDIEIHSDLGITQNEVAEFICACINIFAHSYDGTDSSFFLAAMSTVLYLIDASDDNKYAEVIKPIVEDTDISNNLAKAILNYPSRVAWETHHLFLVLKCRTLAISANIENADMRQLLLPTVLTNTDYKSVLNTICNSEKYGTLNEKLLRQLLECLHTLCENYLNNCLANSALWQLSSKVTNTRLAVDEAIGLLVPENEDVSDERKALGSYLSEINEYENIMATFENLEIYYFVSASKHYSENSINTGDFALFLSDLIKIGFDTEIVCKLISEWIVTHSLQKRTMTEFLNAKIDFLVLAIKNALALYTITDEPFQRALVHIYLIAQYLAEDNRASLFDSILEVSAPDEALLINYIFDENFELPHFEISDMFQFQPDYAVLILERISVNNTMIENVPELLPILKSSRLSNAFTICGKYLLSAHNNQIQRDNSIDAVESTTNDVLIYYLGRCLYLLNREADCMLAAAVVYYYDDFIDQVFSIGASDHYYKEIGIAWIERVCQKVIVKITELKIQLNTGVIKFTEYKQQISSLENEKSEADKYISSPAQFVKLKLKDIFSSTT